MRLEALLRINLRLREWNPVVGTMHGTDSVLAVEQRVHQTVAQKLGIRLPAIIRVEELVTVIEPRRLDTETDGKIDAALEDILRRDPRALDLF